MDILDITNGLSSKNLLVGADNRIKIKTIREKNKNKTYVTGIFDFITDDEKIENFLKQIKKQFGCGGVIKDNADGVVGRCIIFNGNHVNALKDFIIENKIAPSEKIKI